MIYSKKFRMSIIIFSIRSIGCNLTLHNSVSKRGFRLVLLNFTLLMQKISNDFQFASAIDWHTEWRKAMFLVSL